MNSMTYFNKTKMHMNLYMEGQMQNGTEVTSWGWQFYLLPFYTARVLFF